MENGYLCDLWTKNSENATYCRNCGATLIEATNLKQRTLNPQYRTLNRYICVKVTDHKDVADTIHTYQQRGWTLHTYSTAGGVGGGGIGVYHYLLFIQEG